VIPWERLDAASVPGQGEPLRLMRRGAEYSIMSGANELMNSRLSGSEEALARLACARIVARGAPRVLIGGLGMGFTLAAALTVLGPDARVTVAELVPAVIVWARGPLAHIVGASLTDPRVSLHEGDVGEVIAAAPSAFDAIMLDVDNGPQGLSRAENDSLYAPAGLAAARAALRPGGVLAVWSAAPDEPFTRRLARAGFEVEVTRVSARASGRGARHVVWVGVRG
jgi:spermidine synthase